MRPPSRGFVRALLGWVGTLFVFTVQMQGPALLRLMGTGILLAVGVGFVTNAALHYWYGDFRFIHIGTLSTKFFLVLVAYAACFQWLFNVRVLVKRAVVFALLIAFALELYQLAVSALAGLLPLGDPAHRHFATASRRCRHRACHQRRHPTAAPLVAGTSRRQAP